VLDPANYGSLTITGPVSIEGHGWALIAPVSGSAAITINANTGDKINIIGVVLDGTAITNTTGIQFNSGGSLTVRDSVIRNFTGIGILFGPNSSTPNQLFVSNTLISDNVGDGIQMSPTGTGSASGVLNRVQLESNFNGLEVTNTLQIVNVTVANSVSANNVADGILASSQLGNAVSVTVRNSTVAGNGFDGLGAQNAGATIRATRSTITENNIAWAITSSGVVVSYADNNIDDNGSVNTEPPGPLSYK
jgi:hypothetical protein